MMMTSGFARATLAMVMPKRWKYSRSEGKSASLLEQDRPNVFTMNVANIMPGDRIQVELRYTELLVPTDGVYEVVYPTVVGPRYSNQPAAAAPAEDRFVASPTLGQGTPPTYSFSLDARISSGIPLAALSVPSHAARIDWTGKTQAHVTLDPSEKDGGNRDFLLRYRLAGAAIESGLLLQQGDRDGSGENFFLLMVEPPARVTPEQIPPREYVFIVDVSGSMHGYPLDTAKLLLRDLVGGLRPTDTFNVILFSGASQLMAPRSVPASADNIAQALALIDRQDGGGGTELLPALQQAMTLPEAGGTSRSFVVVTDGYIAGERATFQYIRSHLGKANVFSFGIGTAVNRFLIEGVARAGLGEPFVVTDPSEGPDAAARFKSYIESPVLTDIEVAYDGFQVVDVEPASIPDLMARRPIVVHGKWTGTPTGTITVKGVSGNGRFTRVIDVAAAAANARQPALAYLWARARIATLSDFAQGDEAEPEKKEITRLGLQYNLLTRHTSFLAVLDQVRNPQGGDSTPEVAQPLPMPEGVSDAAVGGGVGVGSEPPLALIAAVLALAFAAARLRARTRGARARAGGARPCVRTGASTLPRG